MKLEEKGNIVSDNLPKTIPPDEIEEFVFKHLKANEMYLLLELISLPQCPSALLEYFAKATIPGFSESYSKLVIYFMSYKYHDFIIYESDYSKSYSNQNYHIRNIIFAAQSNPNLPFKTLKSLLDSNNWRENEHFCRNLLKNPQTTEAMFN